MSLLIQTRSSFTLVEGELIDLQESPYPGQDVIKVRKANGDVMAFLSGDVVTIEKGATA